MTRALKDVNLSIREGEVVAIMGPSGCGKSTLLHVLAGIEQPDSGEVWVDNVPLHEMKDGELSDFRLANMGFVFQQYHLIPVLSVLDNIALPLIARGMSEREANRKAKLALEQVGLADKAKHFPVQLSGGQNQRVAIARALVGQPRIIWADEPTGALDSQTAEAAIGLLLKANEWYGTTVVIVTHDPTVASRAGRLIRMDNGRVLPERGERHA